MTLRYHLFFFQCTSFGGVDLLTLRHEFISCSALHLMGSVSLTLRHEFISCSALTSVGSISLTLRHLNPAVDYSLTSRLWACCNCLLIVRWKKILYFFVVGHKSLSFPWWKVSSFKMMLRQVQASAWGKGPPGARLSRWPKWSPFGLRIVVSPLVWLEIAFLFLQKYLEIGSSICLRKGPYWSSPFKVAKNDHHLASESLYLPWFGWKSRFCFWTTFSLFVSFFFMLQLLHVCVQVPQGKGKAVSVLF